MAKELVALGTSSALPTRDRNHNAYWLGWGGQGILFDCGEGTQRQLIHAGIATSRIDVICLTHLHGDHCLGLPGVLQRISLDSPGREVSLVYPAESQEYVDRLRHASIYHDQGNLRLVPVPAGDELREVLRTKECVLSAVSLEHRVPTLGYRVTDPAELSFDAEALAARGISGPDVGRLRREGQISIDGVVTRLDEVTRPRPQRSFAFVMDTQPCAGAHLLARDADLLVMEATYTADLADLAHAHGHSTAVDAATVARDAGAKRLAMTHFSTRYASLQGHLDEASAIHPAALALQDLDRVEV